MKLCLLILSIFISSQALANTGRAFGLLNTSMSFVDNGKLDAGDDVRYEADMEAVHHLGAVEGAEVPGGAVQVRVADAAVLEVEEHVVLAHGAALEAERLEVARGAVAADGEDVDGGGGGRALGGAGGGGHRARFRFRYPVQY